MTDEILDPNDASPTIPDDSAPISDDSAPISNDSRIPRN